MSEIRDICIKAIKESQMIKVILSDVRKGAEVAYHKCTAKPVCIQNEIKYQVTYFVGEKVIHENFTAEIFQKELLNLMGSIFKQAMVYTVDHDYQVIWSKKGKERCLLKPPTLKLGSLTHNRQKTYLIEEGKPCDFMIYLGIMDEKGKVYKKKYDKFKQINKYLEFVEDAYQELSCEDTIRIVDFGCGKAYLTFALYYYFVQLKRKKVDIIGLDLKHDVIDYCNDVALALSYDHLLFKKGDIHDFDSKEKVDMVVSLHACDTATDAALIKAVDWKAKVIFAVPCCHHELLSKLNNDQMLPLLTHGVVKDKLSTIVTDTLRGMALEAMNYSVTLMEFVDLVHTPKNILIRAYLHDQVKLNKESFEAYEKFKRTWAVIPAIDKLFKSEHKSI